MYYSIGFNQRLPDYYREEFKPPFLDMKEYYFKWNGEKDPPVYKRSPRHCRDLEEMRRTPPIQEKRPVPNRLEALRKRREENFRFSHRS